ncbi:PHF7 protein, partial [Bucco capensis]|nr:PHF7 protein [Bucco capensis]
MSSGNTCFRCALCRDKDLFQKEMLRIGIPIPERPPSWENIKKVEILHESYRRCDARECLFPRGREHGEEQGPLSCSSCAAEGTHRLCSNLSPTGNSWQCDGCAGLGTGKRQTTHFLWTG